MQDRAVYKYFLKCALLYSILHIIGKSSALIGYYYKYNTINMNVRFDKSNTTVLILVSIYFVYLYIKNAKSLKRLMTFTALYIILEIIGRYFNFSVLLMLIFSIMYFCTLIYFVIISFKETRIKENLSQLKKRSNGTTVGNFYNNQIYLTYRFQHSLKYKIEKSLYWNFFFTMVLIGFFINDISLLSNFDGIIKYYLLIIGVVFSVVIVMYSLPSILIILYKNNMYTRIGLIEYNKKRILRLKYGSDKHIIKREIDFLNKYKNTNKHINIISKFTYE